VHQKIEPYIVAILRGQRLLKGMNQKELAEKTGFSPSTISRLEDGLRPIDTSHMRELCHAFGISPQAVRAAAEGARDIVTSKKLLLSVFISLGKDIGLPASDFLRILEIAERNKGNPT
jgi:transcriptional regulator with XRE-family HTH domain